MLKKRKNYEKRIMLTIVALCLAGGGFFLGLGSAAYVAAPRAVVAEKDARSMEENENRRLIKSATQYVSMEQVIAFENGESEGLARIVNKAGNHMGIKVLLYLDGVGTLLYESDVVDPGFYIESIQLAKKLVTGEYPCSVVYQFYEMENDEFVGETAEKAIILIRN